MLLWFWCIMITTAVALKKETKRRVVVVGSANYDTTFAVERLPGAGETVRARSVSRCAGGKGLNQAVCVARLGGSASFCGSLGSDAAEMRTLLRTESVRDDCFVSSEEGETGRGLVLVDPEGSVLSVVLAGANDAWSLENALPDFADVDVVMLQREIPDSVNARVAREAKAKGVPLVFLDAGGTDAPLETASGVDWLTPNRQELAMLCQRKSLDSHDDVVAAARALSEQYDVNVLVTLGGRGATVVTKRGTVVSEEAVAAPGGVVDETAAGDSFRAAFALELKSDSDEAIREALRVAACAGAIAVSTKGALPSLPTRAAVQRLRGGATNITHDDDDDEFPWEFASRLNSMKARRDLADDDDGNDVLGWIARQGRVEGLRLVDFNYPQHLTDATDAARVLKALEAAKLRCGAVCLRFPERDFGKGAFSHPDPATRRRAVELSRKAGEWARTLGADEVVLWPQFDGYDYPLQCATTDLWDRTVSCFRALCDALPDLKVSLEYKPTDEKTRFFAVPSAGAACLLASHVDRPNFGLTIDVGHCLAAGENPAHSVAMAARHSRLFGVQLNDWSRFGTEDGLVFGSNHRLAALDVLVAMVEADFKGHCYFDTFPRNEDPVREAALNIRQVKRLHAQATRLLSLPAFHKARDDHDALAILELLEDDDAER